MRGIKNTLLLCMMVVISTVMFVAGGGALCNQTTEPGDIQSFSGITESCSFSTAETSSCPKSPAMISIYLAGETSGFPNKTNPVIKCPMTAEKTGFSVGEKVSMVIKGPMTLNFLSDTCTEAISGKSDITLFFSSENFITSGR